MARVKLGQVLDQLILELQLNTEKLAGVFTKEHQDTRNWLGEQFERIHPVNVDLTAELAEAILAKMQGPLTIPADIEEAIMDGAGKYAWQYVTPPIGHGPGAPFLRIMAHADGSLNLELVRHDATIAWQGTLKGVDE